MLPRYAVASSLLLVCTTIGMIVPALAQAQTARSSPPATTAAPTAADSVSWQRRIDEVIAADIKAGKLHGAVVLVGQRDRILFRKAYGDRAIDPSREAMTVDTIFDAASLTKVVATTTSIMILVQEGRLRLNDRVSDYVPGFERYGKQAITIRHVLTHMSGLRPDIDWSYPWIGYDKAIELAVEEVPVAAPNERFIYSDINFFLLGHIVGRVSGTPLPQFSASRIFEPLKMKDTMFMPPASLQPRIAPTEKCTPYDHPCVGQNMTMLRGTVHDPTARRMGGWAGHAGLFTTADDLAIFARMLLGGGATAEAGPAGAVSAGAGSTAGGANTDAKPSAGAIGSTRILSPLTVARMIAPSMPPGERNLRGLGWDIDSSFSSNRGELLPIGSFGHTGFTGTSLWIDPLTGAYVIFLSNRVHPDGKGDVTPLRARVATIAASALTDVPSLTELRSMSAAAGLGAGRDFGATPAAVPTSTALATPVMTGLDVLRAEGFARLKGKKVGLVTNHTGRARDGATTIDLLFAEKKTLTLVALFSPEHGIRGVLDENVDSSKDEKTGLTIHSLYGATRVPTDAMLQGIDTMVVDLQDIGVRFWTYVSTMQNVLQEAAKRQIEVVVLDRPNPINGFAIEGPTLDKDNLTFVGPFPMPTRHGLTMGELATLFNSELKIGAKLSVVQMKNWNRDLWFDQTGLPWINPSPNMRTMNEATLYPGIGSIEATNISVGRGTDTPFEHIGAPWIDGVAFAAALNARRLPGIQFYPTSFTPTSSKYAKEPCGGVFMIVTDRAALRPVRVGLEIASLLAKMYRDKWQVTPNDRLIGSRSAVARILSGDDPAEIATSLAGDEARWRLLRTKYLLYR